MTPSRSFVPVLPTRNEYHSRLMDGMVRALSEKAYADLTIADIVKAAAVSRRSFYENFETKADCLLALYEAGSQAALEVLRAAVDPRQPWQSQVGLAVSAYLQFLAQDPPLAKTLFVEILGLGLPGLAVRQSVNEQIADFIRMATASGSGPGLSRSLAIALVGGINELILQAMVQDRSSGLPAVVETATQLILAVADAKRVI